MVGKAKKFAYKVNSISTSGQLLFLLTLHIQFCSVHGFAAGGQA